MALSPGTRLGPYEILEPLGAGGMGEVYGARDSRLGRSVAIKVLPGHLASDERLRQRFEREARALAALSHPHICTLHDVGHENGVSFLVMERLEGETLAARLRRGALPPAEVARLGMQIADALDQAHRRGVVHRDLKPENVMMTADGVKLLDFGLARESVNLLGARTGGTPEPPTQSAPLTTEGTILGTIPYMAPEQLEGREADARTDIFALGAVLYESATGRRAFAGNSVANLIASILTEDPPGMSAVNPLAPPALERAVSRCLAKDPEARWQSARDLELELAWIRGAGAEVEARDAAAPSRRSGERVAWMAAVLALAAALSWTVFRPRSAEAPRHAARFAVPPVEGTSSVFARVSPDGRHVSFTSDSAGGVSQIWLRPLDSLTARALTGTEGALGHFWSPDSRFIVFFADGKLKRVDITGGAPQTVCTAPGAGPFRLGAWGPDGTIVFRVDEAPGHREGLFRVSAAGGTPAELDLVDESGGALLAAWPSFLPDGRHFLTMCIPRGETALGVTRAGICVASLDTHKVRRILDVPSYAEYVSPGYLVYARGSSLFAHPFDVGALRIHGEPLRIADGLDSWGGLGPPDFSLSSDGVLVYRQVASQSKLTWKDRSGRTLGSVGPPGIYEDLRLSPDGGRAAVTMRDPRLGLSDLWTIDLERNVATRFTSEGQEAGLPVWSPDGTRLAYCRPSDEHPPFMRAKPLSGGAEEVLLASTGSMQWPSAWSPDGAVLVFTDRHPSTGADLWMLALGDGRNPVPLLRTPFQEYSASFSPDGRWLAYVSDESGHPEVYVQPFPGPGQKVRVSVDGGTLPRWRGDGGELFYHGSGDRLIAVPLRLGPRLEIGEPKPLFDLGTPADAVRTSFDASADGQRFLVIALQPGATSGVTVVLDWAAEIDSR